MTHVRVVVPDCSVRPEAPKTRVKPKEPNIGKTEEIQWRVAFLDAVSGRRIDVEVYAPDMATARERGWAALRASRPAGLVVVELIDTRRADDG